MFIVFDGIDGAGKTTQIELTRSWLASQGVEIETVYDPGSTQLGLKLREVLLGRHQLAIAPVAETLLFIAARAQLVAEKILPSLDQGRIVLCDRFVYSTVVYQGHAVGVDLDQIRQANAMATRGLRADLTFFFDLPPEVAMARIGEQIDRMESRGMAYFEKVRRGFLAEAQRDPTGIHVLDATASPSEIQSIIREQLSRRLRTKEHAR